MNGEPNPSGNPDDEGDSDFERSRDKAKNDLKRLKGDARAGSQTAHLTERLIEIKTGTKWEEVKIKDLPTFAATMKGKRSEGWAACRNGTVAKFATWAEGEGLKTVIDISTDVAEKYIAAINDGSKTAKTLRNIKGMLLQVFKRALPEGFRNPFEAAIIESKGNGGKMEHRTPLTHEEENQLLAVARRSDPFIYKLIVAALSTGLRRGDICRLPWSAANLRDNSLTVETSKTGAEVTLPIMPTLREVLETQLATKEEGQEFIFPEAARLIESNPDAITYRVKRAFALMFSEIAKNEPEEPQEQPEPLPLATILPKVLEAVTAAKMSDSKRSKMVEVVTMRGKGQTFEKIRAATGIRCNDTISALLHEAQDISGLHFMPNNGGHSIRKAIKDSTRKARGNGSRSASKYDFHCLRTTFCTRAISGGFSIDKLKALTGHATVDIVLKHYFKAKGTDYANELTAVMPSGLLGSKPAKALPAATGDRLAEIAATLKELSREQAQLQKTLNRKAVK
jgi:integrase